MLSASPEENSAMGQPVASNSAGVRIALDRKDDGRTFPPDGACLVDSISPVETSFSWVGVLVLAGVSAK